MSLGELAEAGLAKALFALPDRVARLLAGSPIQSDGQELDPHIQLSLKLEKLKGARGLRPVAEARERRRFQSRVVRGSEIQVAEVSEEAIPGPAGEIPARLYRPENDEALPLVVYYHGGGHVLADLDVHDQPCRFLSREIPALVLAVEYRLAPEHRFPAAVDDAVAGFRWAHSQAAALGADPERVAVAGDSAGGNLAAVVAQLTSTTEDGPAPCFQALIYPITDASRNHPSFELFGEGFFLTGEEMDWFRGHYFSSAEERSDPRASPLLAEDLSGLAPAFVVTAGFDPLRDEGEAYAARLREAGVPTVARREPDLVHGFINLVGLGGRPREALAGIAAAMRDGLRPG